MEGSAQELLAHGEWLRRLARALVGEASAEDVVQETYEVALRRAPREGGDVRPWLGWVARNLSRMRRRAAARRARREEQVEAAVAAPSPEELVARARMQERVARMVLELEEPLRATVMLRYYEGLSGAEIARAQGVPEGTVRWRLKRALDEVRARLDEEHRGDRRAWVALVAPLAPAFPAAGRGAGAATMTGTAAATTSAPVAHTLMMGGLAVKTGTKVAALIAVVIALVVGTRYAGLWGGGATGTGTGTGTTDGGAAASGPAARPPAAGTHGVALGGPAGEPRVHRDDDPRGTLRLEGVVLDEAERGVAGARVALDASPPVVVETERDGSFVFEGLIARDYRVEATAGDRYAGPARLRLTPDAEPVTLRLRAGAVVEVAVTAHDGGAPIEGATVELRAALGWRGTTGADGVATLRGVGPIWASLAVSASGYAPAAVWMSVGGAPGATARVAIALHRGAAVSGRVIDEAGAAVAGARVTAAPASEPFPVTDPRRDGVLTAADGTFTLPAVAAGSYRLTASDAHHAAATSPPIVLDGQHPRGGVELVLTAGASVRGVVVDGGGRPVPAADVRVVTRGHVPWRARRQAFTDDGGRFAMSGLPRRGVQLVAWHPQGASAIADVDLAAAREREVRLVLDVTGAIEGAVVDRAGEPVGDAQVMAEPVWSGGTADRAAWHVRGVQELVSDAGGRFRFVGLPPGEYDVRVAPPTAREDGMWQRTSARARPGGPPVRLVLAADGGVTGKVAFADGRAPAAFTIAVNGGPATAFAGDDGAFAVTTPAGAVALEVAGPGLVARRVSLEVADGARTDAGTITVDPGRSVSGRVLDERGAPVEGATVAAGTLLSGGGAELYIPTESVGARSATTDADGRYLLAGFPPTPLTLVAGKDGVGRAASVAVARGADSAVVDLVLQATGGVDGTVTRGGQPLADTVVIANPLGAPSSNFFVVTGPDGSFAFDALTAGDYFLYPMLGGGGNRPKDMALHTVTVTAGRRARIALDASGGRGSLALAIETDAGQPVPMAMVVVVQAAVDAPTLEALRDGTFLTGELRRAGVVMLHMRMGMAGKAEVTEMRPGRYSACAVPIGDPAQARDAERMPMRCVPVAVTDGAATATVVVPAAWLAPPPAP